MSLLSLAPREKLFLVAPSKPTTTTKRTTMVITTHNVDNDNAMQLFYISQQCLYANQNLVGMLEYHFTFN